MLEFIILVVIIVLILNGGLNEFIEGFKEGRREGRSEDTDLNYKSYNHTNANKKEYSSTFNGHLIIDGFCKKCGCTKENIIKYNWMCDIKDENYNNNSNNHSNSKTNAETIYGHSIIDDVCIICGCSKEAILSFGWKCGENFNDFKNSYNYEFNEQTHSNGWDKNHQNEYKDKKNEFNHDKYYGKLFELNGKVTKEQIKKKYRELISKYHPDKVSHLGNEFIIIAEEKTKEITEAYNYFKKKYKF